MSREPATALPPRVLLDPRRYDAVLFDMDGVVTDSAGIHAAAWRELFDDFLAHYPPTLSANRVSFSPEDYRRFVDGKPRRDGIVDFLTSRGISPSADLVERLSERKNSLFLARVHKGEVRAYESTIDLIRRLQTLGIAAGVFSSSRNCASLLASAGLADLFAVRVDGVVAEDLGLAGKPQADTLLEAARRLGVRPERIVIIEDSIAGVRAAAAGGFGMVIGVDRRGDGGELRSAGADVVVAGLSAVDVRTGLRQVSESTAPDTWRLTFDGYDPATERLRETLCTLGNGRFATRGAVPESRAGDVHYPGVYAAGVYNRLTDVVDGDTVEHESIVALPNWLPITFRPDDGTWFDIDSAELLEYRQELALREGILERRFRYRDRSGRICSVVQRRLVSMDQPHVAAIETTVRAENWSGRIEFRSMIDGLVSNSGVRRYRELSGDHLSGIRLTTLSTDSVLLEASTNASHIPIAIAARNRVDTHAAHASTSTAAAETPTAIGHTLTADIGRGESVTLEKVVTLFTGRDHAISEPADAATRWLRRTAGFAELCAAHTAAWERLWNRLDIDLPNHERAVRILRLHLLHLVQTVSPNTADIDAGVPARGLHGEAYRGHMFWDEIFVCPVLNLRLPALTRSLLRYRHRRLPESRFAARAAGHVGAMFPWQSGSDGREESPLVHLNPRSGRWKPDPSARQHHVGLAIAYNVWQYYQVTGSIDFLADYGAEMLVEIGRFWASVAEYDNAHERYVIRGVIGPDEFHSGYPDAPYGGIDNNAYTNVMAVWAIGRAFEALDLLPSRSKAELLSTLGVTDDELVRWRDVMEHMFVPFHDGILSQFEGYEKLAELDWDDYRRRYGDIGRLDRILEAEGDDVNRYRVSKQADVLMLFYLLSADELRDLLAGLGYQLGGETIPQTIDYYVARTSHGSTLSAVVHSWVLARANRQRALEFFDAVLASDVADIQGGTTTEGIHLAAMAGSIDLLQRCFTGLETRGGRLVLGPHWPDALGELAFAIRYRGHRLTLHVTGRSVRVDADVADLPPIDIECRGTTKQLASGSSVSFP